MGVKSGDDDLLPAARDLFVWRVELEQPPSWVEHATRVLTPDELERGSRGGPDVRRRRLVARVALRLVLSGCVQRAPEDLRFVLGRFGKARLVEASGEATWHFSVARSGDCCLIAVTRIGPVGVDVERLTSFPDLERVVLHHFGTQEAAEIMCRVGPAQLMAFFQCWTKKEAYLKATGLGLTVPLDGFSVGVGDHPVVLRAGAVDPSTWTVATLRPGANLIGALAIRGVHRGGEHPVRELALSGPTPADGDVFDLTSCTVANATWVRG